MVDMASLFNMQAMMFLMLIVGLVMKKIGLLTDGGRVNLTNLLMNLILPCNILYAFSTADGSALISLAEVVIMATLLQLLWLILSKLMWKKEPNSRRGVMRYAFQFSNAGYLGNPIVEGMYGAEGLIYAAAYLLPVRIFMWGIGMECFRDGGGGFMKTFKRTVTHPCVIATIVGVLWMMFPIAIPDFIYNTIHGFSQCLTPVTMLLMGCIMAGTDVHRLISKELIQVTVLRLVVQPLITVAICLLLNLEPLVSEVVVMLVAMPAANATAILAAQYDRDELFAGNVVVFTTLLSMLTIPVFGLISAAVFG